MRIIRCVGLALIAIAAATLAVARPASAQVSLNFQPYSGTFLQLNYPSAGGTSSEDGGVGDYVFTVTNGHNTSAEYYGFCTDLWDNISAGGESWSATPEATYQALITMNTYPNPPITITQQEASEVAWISSETIALVSATNSGSLYDASALGLGGTAAEINEDAQLAIWDIETGSAKLGSSYDYSFTTGGVYDNGLSTLAAATWGGNFSVGGISAGSTDLENIYLIEKAAYANAGTNYADFGSVWYNAGPVASGRPQDILIGVNGSVPGINLAPEPSQLAVLLMIGGPIALLALRRRKSASITA